MKNGMYQKLSLWKEECFFKRISSMPKLFNVRSIESRTYSDSVMNRTRWGDSLVRAATTASLYAQQDYSNIAKTQSKATLNVPNPQGEGSGSGPGCQETMKGAMAQIRPEGAPIQSSDPPLSTGNTVRSGEDRMYHAIELTDPVLQIPHDSPLSGGDTPRSDEGSMTLKELMDLCTTLSQKSWYLGKDKESKEKRVAFKDADDSARPIRSITTLKPLPTINPKDKGKGILQEHEPVKKTKKTDQDQIERDAKVALKIQADLDEEVRIKRERQEEASKASLVELYYEVQLQIDANHELAAILTHEEEEKYTVKERFSHTQLKSGSLEEIQKLYTKGQKWIDAFIPIGSKEDEKNVGSRKKRAASSSSKQKSPKKQKVNDQKSVESDKEFRKWLKVLGTMETCDVNVYKLTRLDGSYRHFSTFSRMLEVLDRQDVLDLHKIVMERFPANDPEEKRYPLTKEILEKMLSWRLEAETKSTLALDLIKFIKLQIEEK
nr:hypothetical protein [Tanacetum cinerariifolium]